MAIHAVSVQDTCAGGKHNDLDNVARTPRHHTFLRCGNFSFGDISKKRHLDGLGFCYK